MFAIERIRIIKNQLKKEKKVSVAKLSEFLNVTEVTIRRDLEKLEKEDFLKRTHGGAILIEHPSDDLTDQSTVTNTDTHQIQRKEIADTAYHLISDGDTIMITDGLTNQHIATKLVNRQNLTVITNDMRIGLTFAANPSNHTIILGGDLDGNAAYGQLALNNMRLFSFNHLFIEIEGLETNLDMSVTSINKATLIQEAIPLADKITVICPSSNIGSRSLFKVGHLRLANQFITDSLIRDTFKNIIYDQNLPLYTSIDIYEE